jgi:hypothetical protein
MTPSETFDWYSNYEELREIVVKHVAQTVPNILVVGCGNSSA